MDILKPPTDNLYKFIAISGLLIFLASFIFPQILDRDYVVKYAEVGGEIRALEHQRDMLHDIDPQSDNPSKRRETDPEIQRRQAEFDKGLAEVQKNHEMSKALGSYARRWRLFGIIGMAFGLAMMLSGFYFWYTRLQKYEDKIIKSKVSDSV